MSKQKPKVSVLMNCHNSDQYLREAIDSVYNQSFQDFEIVFIDNMSSDQSAAIAQSYDQRLRYIKTEKFLTLYGARDFGLDYIQGEYLAFLDCDDLWYPDKLQHQLEIFERLPVDFVYGGYRQLFDYSVYPPLTRCRIVLKNFFFRCRQFLKLSGLRDLNKIIQNYDINLQTVLLKKDKIGQIRFNSRCNLIGDLVFFFELGLVNQVKFYYDRKIVSQYRCHSNQLSHKRISDWYKEIRYASMFIFNGKMTNEQKKLFQNIYIHFKSNFWISRGQYKAALDLKNSVKWANFSFFKDWLTCSVVYCLSRPNKDIK